VSCRVCFRASAVCGRSSVLFSASGSALVWRSMSRMGSRCSADHSRWSVSRSRLLVADAYWAASTTRFRAAPLISLVRFSRLMGARPAPASKNWLKNSFHDPASPPDGALVMPYHSSACARSRRLLFRSRVRLLHDLAQRWFVQAWYPQLQIVEHL